MTSIIRDDHNDRQEKAFQSDRTSRSEKEYRCKQSVDLYTNIHTQTRRCRQKWEKRKK